MDNALVLAGTLLACAVLVLLTLGPFGVLVGAGLAAASVVSAGIWLLREVLGRHRRPRAG